MNARAHPCGTTTRGTMLGFSGEVGSTDMRPGRRSVRRRARPAARLLVLGACVVVALTSAPVAVAAPTAPGPSTTGPALPFGYRATSLVSVTGQGFAVSEVGNPISPEDDRVAGLALTPRGDEVDGQAAVFSVRQRTLRVLHPPGSTRATAVDVNRYGQVTGTAFFLGAPEQTYVWSPASNTYRLLGSFGGNFSRPTALNDSGVVVGSASRTDFTDHAFVSDPAVDRGRMRDLGTVSGDVASGATSVNDAGTVVGWSGTCGPCRGHGFTWSAADPVLRDLGHVPGDNVTWPIDINAAGTIVGQTGYEPGGTEPPRLSRAFVYLPRTRQLRVLPSRPDQAAAATAINVHGVIVGTSTSTLLSDQALLWNACGRAVTVLLEGSYGTGAVGINRYEHVVGSDFRTPTFWRRHDGPCRTTVA